MNHLRILITCCLLVFIGTIAAAYDIQQGIHKMNWGSYITKYDNLIQVNVSGHAAYYSNASMLYQVANQPIPGVFYGFYKDQFFSVFIKLRSALQFSQMQQRFTARYGQPKTTSNAEDEQKVYRWKDGDVKIKLKTRESTDEYKLAFYYSPLASKLNQEQLDRISSEAFEQTPPQKDKTIKATPLLDF